MPLPTLVLTAMAWEADAVRGSLEQARPEGEAVWRGRCRGREIVLVCGGMGPRRAEQAAGRFADTPLAAVFSIGCAGALVPGLTAGQLVLAPAVRMFDGAGRLATFDVDARLLSLTRNAARQAGVATTSGAVFTSAHVLPTPEKKRDCAARTECVAVEMESGAHARFAAGRGLPFAVVRVILDPLDMVIPAMPGVIRPDGGVRPAAALRHLAIHPGQVGSFMRLQRCRKWAADTISRLCREIFAGLDDEPGRTDARVGPG